MGPRLGNAVQIVVNDQQFGHRQLPNREGHRHLVAERQIRLMEIQTEQNVLPSKVKIQCGARGKMVDNLCCWNAKWGLVITGDKGVKWLTEEGHLDKGTRIIWNNKMHYFLLIYFNSRLAAHYQEDQLCINSNWYSHALCWLATGSAWLYQLLLMQSWPSWWWAASLLETCTGLLLK